MIHRNKQKKHLKRKADKGNKENKFNRAIL